MKLTKIEQAIFAYFVSGDARGVHVDGRFYRREDFIQVFEDRIFYVTQGLGEGLAGRYPKVAETLVDELIERRALTTVTNRLSGPLHQFDPGVYKQVLNDLSGSNSFSAAAEQAGPPFWEKTFAALRSDPERDAITG